MEHPVATPWDPAPREEDAVPACPRCGERNSETARFCQQCGTSLVEEASPLRPAPRADRTATAVACEVSRVTSSWGEPETGSYQWAEDALGTVRSILERHGGTLEDLPESPNTVVAVFGPAEGDGTLRAVEAAAEIRAAVPADEPGSGEAAVAVRTGVGACEVEDGDPRDRSTGRAVDLAVRLQRMAAPGEVILAEDVHRIVGDAASVEPVDRRARLDGDEPVGPLRLLSVAPEPTALRHLAEAPLVGRDRERALLREAFQRTVSHRTCGLLAVVGDPGVGKTALVEDLLRALEQDGAARVLRVRCRPTSEGGASWPLADLVEQAAGIDDRDPADEARRRIGALFQMEEVDPVEPVEAVEAVEAVDEAEPVEATEEVEQVHEVWATPEAPRKDEELEPAEGEPQRVERPGGIEDAEHDEANTEAGSAPITGWLARAVGLSGGAPVPEETPWAVRRLLETLARQGPLAVSVDDADRAGPGLWRLLRDVAARTRGVPVLVLCTGARELPGARPGWEASDAVTVVPLEPLAEEDVESLVEHLLGGGDVDPDVRAVVAAAALGNPFVAGQVLAGLVEQDLLRWDRGRWAAAADLSSHPMPSGVEPLLEARLQALALEERAVVGLAAVVGETFPWDPMSELLPGDARDAVRDHLDALVRKGLIRPERSDPSGEAFAFRHPSIRDAAARSVPDEARAEVHERYARWLEQAAGDRLPRHAEVIGSHLASASRLWTTLGRGDEHARELSGRSASLLEMAAGGAADLGNERGAFLLFDRASSLVPSDDPRRSELLLQAALAVAGLGEFRPDAVLSEAAAAARASGDRGAEWRAKVLSAILGARSAPDLETAERARATADKAIEAFRELEDDRGLAWAWSLRGLAHRRWGHTAAFARAAERVAAHASAAGMRREEQAALRDLAWACLHGPFHVDEGVRRCEEILERVRGERPAEQEVAGVLALLAARRGRFDEARRLASRAVNALEEAGLAEEQATGLHRSGLIEALADEHEAAVRAMRGALDLADRLGAEAIRAQVAASLAHLVGARGRAEEALELTQLAERAAAPDDMVAQVGWRTARAKALARLEREGEADATARRAVRMAEQTDSAMLRAEALLDLAEVLHLAGRTNEALPFARRSLRTFDRGGADAPASRARALLARLSARQERRAPAPEEQATTPER